MTSQAELSKGMLEHVLNEIKELSHLKIRLRGDVLTLESTDEYDNVYPHARFRKQPGDKWSLEMPVKKGWEPTFMEGTIIELMEMLLKQFPWALAPR